MAAAESDTDPHGQRGASHEDTPGQLPDQLGSITLAVHLMEPDGEGSTEGITLRRQDAAPAPAPIAVYGTSGTHVALVPPSLHSEVELILETGLPLRVSLDGSEIQIEIDE
jgi:hypothetical protein